VFISFSVGSRTLPPDSFGRPVGFNILEVGLTGRDRFPLRREVLDVAAVVLVLGVLVDRVDESSWA